MRNGTTNSMAIFGGGLQGQVPEDGARGRHKLRDAGAGMLATDTPASSNHRVGWARGPAAILSPDRLGLLRVARNVARAVVLGPLV